MVAAGIGVHGVSTAHDVFRLPDLWQLHLYHYDGKPRLFCRDLKLSDDVGYRFSNPSWDRYPLYADTYAGHVVDVEYDDTGFAAACKGWASRISVVRRDVDVTAAGDAKHVFRTCRSDTEGGGSESPRRPRP